MTEVRGPREINYNGSSNETEAVGSTKGLLQGVWVGRPTPLLKSSVLSLVRNDFIGRYADGRPFVQGEPFAREWFFYDSIASHRAAQIRKLTRSNFQNTEVRFQEVEDPQIELSLDWTSFTNQSKTPTLKTYSDAFCCEISALVVTESSLHADQRRG